MNTRLWFGIVVVSAALLSFAPAPADAQARQRYPTQPPVGANSGYDYGYQDGLSRGDLDGRRGRTFRFENAAEYREATRGWSGHGSREQYRQSYRQGYTEGYRTAYARYQRDARYGRNVPWGGYPGSTYPGSYPDRGYPGYPAGGYGRDYGYDRGYQEGYREGLDAGRDGDRYDPQREKDYRKADDGYNKRYGTKDYYKQSYRNGFLAGYQRGYGEGRDSRYNRGYRWP